MTKSKKSEAVGTNQPGKRTPWPRIDPPRPLTDREQEVLTFLVSQPFPGHEELRLQVPAARVAVQEPGGATISLEVDRSAVSPASVTRRIPVAASGQTKEGKMCEVILFVDDGYVSGMEMVEYPTMTRKDDAQFPPLSSLTANVLAK